MREGKKALGRVPVLVSEVGIPFDVNDSLRRAAGDYRTQTMLLGALVSALEKNWVSFTLWNYNPDNAVQHGDLWNQEDFSIINLEEGAQDRDNIYATEAAYRGGRALSAILRPYACKVAGEPRSTSWDWRRAVFEFSWTTTHTTAVSGLGAVTEVYIPDYYFRGTSPRIVVSDGTYEYRPETQTLYLYPAKHVPGSLHSVQVTLCPETTHVPMAWLAFVILMLAVCIWQLHQIAEIF